MQPTQVLSSVALDTWKRSGVQLLDSVADLLADRARGLLGAATAAVFAAVVAGALLVTTTVCLAALLITIGLQAGWTPVQAAAGVSVVLMVSLLASALFARSRARAAMKSPRRADPPRLEEEAAQELRVENAGAGFVVATRAITEETARRILDPARWAREHPVAVIGASAALGLALSTAFVPNNPPYRKESA